MKPFKVPTIVGRVASQTEPVEISQGPPKRRRISPEPDEHKATAPKPVASFLKKPLLSASIPQRTPLKPITPSNGNTQTHVQPSKESTQYFTVLWRRFTTKKNKTWDGDGIVAVSNGFATLEDISGRVLGRVQCNKELSVGSQLTIAGREIEVDSLITKQEAISAHRFLPKAPLKSAAPSQATSERPYPKARNDLASLCRLTQVPGNKSNNADFKLPLARTENSSTARDGKVPTPRHEPDAPGALVMKRPKSAPKGKRLVDVVVDPMLTKHLREHQRIGVSFMYECVMGMKDYAGEGAVLADEMGLGKTLQTIALIWTLLKQNPVYENAPIIRKALIVCPVTLINNWRKEFRKWLGNERIGVLVADEKHTRITDFTHGKAYSVMIIGYERLRSVKEELQKGEGVDIVIADEGHRLKTAKNKSADAIKSLSTERRIILSGTPIQNDLEEFYTMVDFVNPNLLGKYSVFKREFETPILKSQQPGATKKELEKGEARSEELANITGMFILRRTAEILSKYLPPKTEYVVFCKPTSPQATAYRSIIGSPMFSAALGSTALALELINVLKKVCNAPSLLLSKDDNEESMRKEIFDCVPTNLLRSPGASGKLRVLDSLLHKIRTTTNDKVVLVSNYTATLDVLAKLLASLDYGYLRLDGSTPASKRQDLVDRFNRSNANNFFVFLLSAKAGGTGLNLIGASRLVLFDIDWNPATDLQAMARVHRDGQKKPCYIYRLITKGALDEKIFQRQVCKTGLADSIVDGKGSASSFTRAELRDLFTLDESDGCQTHKLLGCPCANDGECHAIRKTGLLSLDATATVNPSEANEDDVEVLHLEEEPTPVVSSSTINSSFTSSAMIDMDAQEAEIQRNARSSKDSAGSSKLLGLMLYTHLDTAVYKDKQPSIEDDSDIDPAKSDIVEDAALRNVLEEDGGRVNYIFIKKNV